MSLGNQNVHSAQVAVVDPAAAQSVTTLLRVPSTLGKITVVDWWAAASDATPFTADGVDSVTFTLTKYDSSGALAGTISAAALGGTATWAAEELKEGSVSSGGTVDGGESVRVQYDEAGTVAFSTPFTVGIDYVIGVGE